MNVSAYSEFCNSNRQPDNRTSFLEGSDGSSEAATSAGLVVRGSSLVHYVDTNIPLKNYRHGSGSARGRVSRLVSVLFKPD